METFFIPALAVFLVVTIIAVIIADWKDSRPSSRAYAAIGVLAVIAFTLLVMREFIMLIAVSRP